MPVFDELIARSVQQHGSVSIPQLMQLQPTPAEVRHLTTSGQWLRITPNVLRRAGTPASRGQRVVEAVLDAGPGAALSHRSDAAWWRLRGFNLADLEVTRLRDANSTPARLARVIHEPRCFPPHHRTILDGVCVIVPSRIPFDLAATQPWLAEKALDRAWVANLLSYRSSMRMLEELTQRGRKGVPLVRALLEERGPDYRPNDTNLEDRFLRLAKEAGFTDLERQRNLLDSEWLGRFDFVSRRLWLVLEVDSAFCHGALIDTRDDERRTEDLTAAGYRVERFTDTAIFFDPQGTVARLRAIRLGK
jgi:very-short-patch-repair endonuclease